MATNIAPRAGKRIKLEPVESSFSRSRSRSSAVVAEAAAVASDTVPMANDGNPENTIIPTPPEIMKKLYEDARKRSRWNWLLEPDGTFATRTTVGRTRTTSNSATPQTVDVGSIAITATQRDEPIELEAAVSSVTTTTTAAVPVRTSTTDPGAGCGTNQIPNGSRRSNERSWHWLLEPNGRPATFETAARRGWGRTRNRTERLDPSATSQRRNPDAMTEIKEDPEQQNARIIEPNADSDFDGNQSIRAEAVSSSTIKKPRDLLPKKRSWHWLLDPDGSFATIGSGRPLPDASLSIPALEPGMGGRMTSETIHECESPRSGAVVGTHARQNRQSQAMLQQRTWHWLVSPDGSAVFEFPKSHDRSKRSNDEEFSNSDTDRTVDDNSESDADDEDYPVDDDDEEYVFNQLNRQSHRRKVQHCIDCNCNPRRLKNDLWMEKYRRLLKYKNKYGTTCVPYRWKDDPQLGTWVLEQRHRCKYQHRIKLLNDIGFVWQVVDPNRWIKMYGRLVAYKKKYGTTCVPRYWKDDPQLGRWVSTQRAVCKDQHRIKLLNDIGFVWQLVDPNPWMTMYGRLLTYKKKYGTTCVPFSWKDDPQLGHWVSTQRSRCKEQHRIKLLNDIGFVWQVVDPNQWTKMYGCLVAYKQKHGTTRVPIRWKDDPQLGYWVSNQRAACKDQHRIDLLDKVDFVWRAREP